MVKESTWVPSAKGNIDGKIPDMGGMPMPGI